MFLQFSLSAEEHIGITTKKMLKTTIFRTKDLKIPLFQLTQTMQKFVLTAVTTGTTKHSDTKIKGLKL